jgi:hypothetical protein
LREKPHGVSVCCIDDLDVVECHRSFQRARRRAEKGGNVGDQRRRCIGVSVGVAACAVPSAVVSFSLNVGRRITGRTARFFGFSLRRQSSRAGLVLGRTRRRWRRRQRGGRAAGAAAGGTSKGKGKWARHVEGRRASGAALRPHCAAVFRPVPSRLTPQM